MKPGPAPGSSGAEQAQLLEEVIAWYRQAQAILNGDAVEDIEQLLPSRLQLLERVRLESERGWEVVAHPELRELSLAVDAAEREFLAALSRSTQAIREQLIKARTNRRQVGAYSHADGRRGRRR